MKIPIEFRRLFGAVRRYRWGLAAAVILMALVGAAEGLTALMARPVFDRVLQPSSAGNSAPLVTFPWNHHTVYLNSFFPPTIHNPWVIFAISLLAIAIVKGIAEFSGTMLVQYIGLAVVTDLRHQIFSKLIRQPIGFFQNHPIGRLMSAVISDVERVRNTLSDWLADSLHQIFGLAAWRCARSKYYSRWFH